MLDERSKAAPIGWGMRCLVVPLLLTHCGGSAHSVSAGAGAGNANANANANANDGGAGSANASNAGAGNAGAQGGVVNTLGGATNLGGASASNGGSAGTSANGGLGGDSAAGNATGAGAGGRVAGAAGSGDCGNELTSYTSPSAAHVALCSAISYPMNPPVYGDHYPVWAAYKSYPFPVPLGFLVHNLEHGAIVLLYNCPEGCAEEVASAQAFIDSLPADPRCGDDVKHQVVMSPDPSLPTRWAAVAWGHSLASDCFAPAAFGAFYTANLAHGSEDLCNNGADLLADACQ